VKQGRLFWIVYTTRNSEEIEEEPVGCGFEVRSELYSCARRLANEVRILVEWDEEEKTRSVDASPKGGTRPASGSGILRKR
jgi:hypothetical protein